MGLATESVFVYRVQMVSPNETEPEAFETLLAWRTAKGYDQSTAAKKLGVSQATYSRMERGVQIPRPRLRKRIVAKSHVAVESLIGAA